MLSQRKVSAGRAVLHAQDRDVVVRNSALLAMVWYFISLAARALCNLVAVFGSEAHLNMQSAMIKCRNQ